MVWVSNYKRNECSSVSFSLPQFSFLDVHPLLLHAEELHQSALDLSLNVFGEMNVQTAKHYGNLGRLYQSMTKYYVSSNLMLSF